MINSNAVILVMLLVVVVVAGETAPRPATVGLLLAAVAVQIGALLIERARKTRATSPIVLLIASMCLLRFGHMPRFTVYVINAFALGIAIWDGVMKRRAARPHV